MKVLCLALLLILTFQLKITKENKLAGKSFIIIENGFNFPQLNGIVVSFTPSKIGFEGCNKNWANYKTDLSTLKVSKEWKSSHIPCSQAIDNYLQTLIDESEKISLVGQTLTLSDRDGEAKLALKRQ